MKNTFTPINRIPEDVLSLVPRYRDTDKELVTLTHVCRGWRERFIACSSLWTALDCTSVEQTRVHLERSKGSPLEICLQEEEEEGVTFLNDAFLLVVPHLDRLKSLTLSGSSDDLIQLTKYFASPAPLLEELNLCFTGAEEPVFQDDIFDGDFSSLRELHFCGVTANLARGNLTNLRTFDLRQVPGNKMSVTRLLDLFERAPLRKIQLWDAFPDSSDAPPGQVVSLPHLKFLIINAQPAHTILLNHLSIPAGASLKQEFDLNDDKSPFPTHLPKTLDNLKNISHITSINLSFNSGTSLRLHGPSGTHYLYGYLIGASPSLPILDGRILQSLSLFRISMAERLAITEYGTPLPARTETTPVYLTLLPMKNLRILTLTNSLNLPFVFALNPNKNPSRTVVCPKLEELFLYIMDKDKGLLCINELLEVAKERAASGSKISAIAIVCREEFVPAKQVFRLKRYVSRVEYRLDDVAPEWDAVPADADCADYESGW